jgi:cysteinyl-tRNA synthetase
MDDDLNVPQALAAVHETVRAGNTALDAKDKEAATRALHQVMAMTDVLHINPLNPHWHAGSEDTAAHQALDTLVRAQLEERRAARAAKDWSRADAIRDTLAEAGIVVEDSAEGASWSLG